MAANSILPLSVLTLDQTQLHDVSRRSADFHPSIWGDYFLSYSSQAKLEVDAPEWQEHQHLREKVKNMIMEAQHTTSQKLDLINKIQHLGVCYQFQKEIEATLQQIFEAYNEFNVKEDENDLYIVSLKFRLLRQGGYPISSNVFEKFTNSEGKFSESLINNVPAMLSLYEASHLRVHGEKILEEALTFTTSHLQSMLPNLTSLLRTEVSEALKQPFYKRIRRLEAKRYISIYEVDETHDPMLLKLAKLDFNMLQKEHKRELGIFTRWWKDLDVTNNFPFARDRLVEGYFWTLGIYFEPQYSLARKFFFKVISMSSIIDDIHDVYGTPNELQLFSDAIERWDATAVNELPEYMKICYMALLDVYVEMEKELAETGELYRIDYAKTEMKIFVRTQLKENKWLRDRCTPKFEEYMKLATETCGLRLLLTTSLVGMQEDFVTKEAFDWVTKGALIVEAASVICRLMDDIAGHEFEQQRGHVASSVECYMNEYKKSKEDTYKELQERVINAWKDINQECFKPLFPMPILTRALNFSRIMDTLYDDGDSYTHSKTKMKDYITSLFVDPVP
ncbi:(-)-germacrene D synthase-like [Ipomoea triloba]|uniref:(-)-germacrene D synthase-like n=1 Tax=Ipomoea triloba TaxID=35885 RepID=UPI00125CD956|nr:(-)-germacrene D synthase-like [Ipomoea triloba]